MCLACEEQEYFFRLWCMDFLARGEIGRRPIAQSTVAILMYVWPKPGAEMEILVKFCSS